MSSPARLPIARTAGRPPRRRPRPGLGVLLVVAASLGLGAPRLSAVDRALVAGTDTLWLERFIAALEALEKGAAEDFVQVLRRALSESDGVLVEVPRDLDDTGNDPDPEVLKAFRELAAPREEPKRDTFQGPGPMVPGPGVLSRQAPADGRRFLSVPIAARLLVRRLPPDVRDLYRRRLGEAAEELLRELDATRDPKDIGRLYRRYYWTRPALEAQEAEGDLALEAGRIRESRALYGDILRSPGLDAPTGLRVGKKHLASLRVLGDRRAYAAARQGVLDAVAGEPSALRAELLELERRVPFGPRVARSSTDRVPPGSCRWGGELEEGALPILPTVPVSTSFVSWLWSDGVSLDDAVSVLYSSDPRLGVIRRRVFRSGPSPYPFVPLADGNRIYVSGLFHLYVLDGSIGGGKLVREMAKPTPPRLRAEFNETSESPLYTTTLWRRAPGGPPGLPREVAITHYIYDRIAPEGYQGYAVRVEIAIRGLVAFDAATGKLLWRTVPLSGASAVGGTDDAGRAGAERSSRGPSRTVRAAQVLRAWERLGPQHMEADVSYTSPAIVRGDRVYAAGWRQEGAVSGVVRALDLRTGRTVWESLVSSAVFEQTLFGELGREPFASFLEERDGVLYHLSNMGTVAALNAADGDLLWVTTYDTIEVPQTLRREPYLRPLAWSPNPPLLLGHVLIVAPRDSAFLYAIDTGRGPGGEGRSGRILWRYDNRREDLRDLLGFHDDALFFTGAAGVVALDLAELRADGTFPESDLPERRPSPLTWGRNRITSRGALTSAGIVFADSRRLWLVPHGLDRTAEPILVETLDPARNGSPVGSLQVTGRLILMTGTRILSAFSSSEP